MTRWYCATFRYKCFPHKDSIFKHIHRWKTLSACLQMRFRVCPGYNVHLLIIHSSSLCIPISHNACTHTHTHTHTHIHTYTNTHTHIHTHTHMHPYKCRRQVAVLRHMPGFLPPGVSGDGDAGGLVVLQRLQGREETSLQTNCLGQTGQLQVRRERWWQTAQG